jgi:hypothetical protein
MNIGDFQILIKNLPVRKQSGRTSREIWRPFEESYPWLETLNNNIFQGLSIVTLSREDVFNSAGNIREFIIKTILWGYLRGMRGNYFNDILNNIELIESYLFQLSQKKNLSNLEFNDAVKFFAEIRGLGLSTYSKLLYFLKIKICDYPALILDFRIIVIFERQTFNEFSQFRSIRRHNARVYYIDYLRVSYQLAQNLDTYSENIEQFIYIFGDSIKE